MTQLALQVGCVEGGLCALEWSPDGELLAAVSGRGSLLVMNTVREGARGLIHVAHWLTHTHAVARASGAGCWS